MATAQILELDHLELESCQYMSIKDWKIRDWVQKPDPFLMLWAIRCLDEIAASRKMRRYNSKAKNTTEEHLASVLPEGELSLFC